MASTATSNLLALEELRQLQIIIGRHEGQEFQIRGWLLVLVGALVAALLAKDSKLPPAWFAAVSAIFIVAFFLMELWFACLSARPLDVSKTLKLRSLRGAASTASDLENIFYAKFS